MRTSSSTWRSTARPMCPKAKWSSCSSAKGWRSAPTPMPRPISTSRSTSSTCRATSPPLLDTALMLMRETASELSFDPGAIDREKGVVLSEKRVRDTYALRNAMDRFAFLYPDALFVETAADRHHRDAAGRQQCGAEGTLRANSTRPKTPARGGGRRLRSRPGRAGNPEALRQLGSRSHAGRSRRRPRAIPDACGPDRHLRRSGAVRTPKLLAQRALRSISPTHSDVPPAERAAASSATGSSTGGLQRLARRRRPAVPRCRFRQQRCVQGRPHHQPDRRCRRTANGAKAVAAVVARIPPGAGVRLRRRPKSPNRWPTCAPALENNVASSATRYHSTFTEAAIALLQDEDRTYHPRERA